MMVFHSSPNNKKMILIDAVYINNGGGKILLDYLISSLEESESDVFYLLDERVRNNHPRINNEKVFFIKANFLKRQKFYLENKSRFTRVLCFGNLPPNIGLNAVVYTYFHQLIYLNIPKEFFLKDQIKFRLKILILKLIAKNTNYWLVQSGLIKEKLHEKFLFKPENIKVLPFYPQFGSIDEEVIRQSHTYIYVSNANPHKNHARLLEVFCNFYDKHKKGKLILTVNNDFPEVLELIGQKQRKGYPIKNIGFVGRRALQKEYLSSEYLIFPSLAESFGLGLIEAIECGCKVIGADLPYTYEVCEPSIVFNPMDDESFLEAFEKSLNDNVKISIPKIQNNINELINILQDNPCN